MPAPVGTPPSAAPLDGIGRFPHASLLHQVAIGFWPAVPEELPHVPHFLNLVEVQVCHNNFFFVPRSFSNDFSARCAEIALTVKLSNVPRLLAADPVDSTDKIPIGH